VHKIATAIEIRAVSVAVIVVASQIFDCSQNYQRNAAERISWPQNRSRTSPLKAMN
jgi:hypothetical protein